MTREQAAEFIVYWSDVPNLTGAHLLASGESAIQAGHRMRGKKAAGEQG